MKSAICILLILFTQTGTGQFIDTLQYHFKVENAPAADSFFKRSMVWRGGDGAASVDLGNGKVLWLFGDSFIAGDAGGSRKNSVMVRNSIAIQNGYEFPASSIRYYWDSLQGKPRSFFNLSDQSWYWPGHGTMVKDKLLIFLMKLKEVKTGLGFETTGWNAVLISNPTDDPANWKMKYIEGAETYGTVAGSAAVLKDGNFLYAFGAVEPATHEVYLLRWNLEDVYTGNLRNPAWWVNGHWIFRKSKDPVPAPLFIGGTEYSVHYDAGLKKYLQIQSFGFGEAKIGLRMADSLQGPWSEPLMFYLPEYRGIKRPFMYSAKAHPELKGSGMIITYNINSFDFDELLENRDLYFPRFISLKIEDNTTK